MNSAGKTLLGQSSATLDTLLLFTNFLSDLSIGGSPPDTTPICEDAVLQVLFTGDRRQKVSRNTHDSSVPIYLELFSLMIMNMLGHLFSCSLNLSTRLEVIMGYWWCLSWSQRWSFKSLLDDRAKNFIGSMCWVGIINKIIKL